MRVHISKISRPSPQLRAVVACQQEHPAAPMPYTLEFLAHMGTEKYNLSPSPALRAIIAQQQQRVAVLSAAMSQL